MSYSVIFETEDNNININANEFYYQERIKNKIIEKIFSFDISGEELKEKNKILVLSHENLKSIYVNNSIIENNINKFPKIFTIEFSNLSLITNKRGSFINIIMNYSLSLED